MWGIYRGEGAVLVFTVIAIVRIAIIVTYSYPYFMIIPIIAILILAVGGSIGVI